MSLFAPEPLDANRLLRPNPVGASDGDFLADRPNSGGGAGLIEEEDAGSSERTFSDAGGERTEDADEDLGGLEPMQGQPMQGQGTEGQGVAGQAQSAAPVAQRGSGPGLLARAWAGIKRGASSLGRGLSNAVSGSVFGSLFGSRRAAPDPSEVGAAEEAQARRDYQASAGRTVDDSTVRKVVGAKRPWMARLFGAGPGGRGSAAAAGAAARVGAETRHMRSILGNRPIAPGRQAYLASTGRGPGVPFMEPTPDKVGYGEGKNRERHPVGYTPNSAWASPAHGQAPSEQVGAGRGVGKSGGTPSQALTGLEAARQTAMNAGTYMPPGMIRGGDSPELRASAQERRVKARRVAADLAKVDPKAGAAYRMNRTWQKAGAALGATSLIPEVPKEIEDIDT